MMLNVGCGDDVRGEIRVDLRKDGSANVIADAQHLPFRDDVFDYVISISVLEHIPNWSQALQEIFRVSRNHVIVEVPVNSDLRITEGFRLLFPTLSNIRLFLNTPERAREHIWQFEPWKLLNSAHNLAPEFSMYVGKIFQFYCGVPSRAWRLRAWRDD